MTDPSISKKIHESPDELEEDDVVTLLISAGDPESDKQNESLRLLNEILNSHSFIIEEKVGTNSEIEITRIQEVLKNLQAESRLTRELAGKVAPDLFQVLYENDSDAAVNHFQQMMSEDNPHSAQLALESLNENYRLPNEFESYDFSAFPHFINEENDALVTEICEFVNKNTSRYGNEIFDSRTQDRIVHAVVNRLEKTVSRELIEVINKLDWPEDAISEIASVSLQLINHEDEYVRTQAIEWAEEIAQDTPHGKAEPGELIKIAEKYQQYIYDENEEIRADVFKIYTLVVKSQEFLSNISYADFTSHRRVLIKGLNLESTRKTAASGIFYISEIDKDIFVKEIPELVKTLLKSDSARVRASVAGAIWRISDENPDIVSSTIPSLIQSLDDPSRRTVESVLSAINFNLIDEYIDEFKPAVSRLIPLLDAEGRLGEVRGLANGVFGTIADKRPEWILPYVTDLLTIAEDHPPVLTHVETLSTKQPETVRSNKDEIRSFLDHERPTAREYACLIAGKTTLLEVVDKIGEISQDDPEPDVREAADEAINMIAEGASEQISSRARDPNANALEFSESTPSQEPITHEVPFFIEQISDKVLLALNNGNLLDLRIYSVELSEFVRENPVESPEYDQFVSKTGDIVDRIEMERDENEETVSDETEEMVREVINRAKKIYLRG